jgi:hypothetical protein
VPYFLLLEELCPLNLVPKDHIFVVLKTYFDGGNHADSTVHDVISLAALSGTKDQWKPLEKSWIKLMNQHGIGNAFHTTDLVALSGIFSRKGGWDEARRDKFLGRCVSLIERHIALPMTLELTQGRLGIYPFTVTVPLSDHKRARQENADVPKHAATICAVQALGSTLIWGEKHMKVTAYQFIFDRGEPFKGHVEDRRVKKAIREFPALERITVTEAASSTYPALQIADLYAWCVSQKNKRDFKWQKRLLSLPREDEYIPYDLMIHPNALTVKFVREWKLPARKANP